LILSGLFVWTVSVYRSTNRQFANAYTAYRGIEQPDSSKLDEWDTQMGEAYLTMKQALTAGDKDQAKGHEAALISIIGAQEEFGLKMNAAYAEETSALPGLKTKASVLDGKKKTLAERIVKNEAEILKIGQDLNSGSLDEMKYWRLLDDNFSRFMNDKIDGSTFLARENTTEKTIDKLRNSQVKPAQKAESLVKQINADWKELKPLL
jgi:hypothetical protein